MKITSKRVLSWLMSLVMLLGLLGGLSLAPVQAATVDYVYSGNYVYNWGTRETVATFLSPMAEDWYEDNNTSYAELAALSGSSSTSSVPSSAMFDALHKLMYNNLDDPTSYDGTKELFQYTDCQNSGKDSKRISSFYSGTAIGPSWDAGKTWNREHCWPNSKSNGGSDNNSMRETDIMMLRPTSVSENSSRSNTAYGEGSSFYHPNEESGGTYDLRGDVSRIVLYVYVCWGGSSQHDGALNYMWGASGVMESKAVLLKWMEEDPVDTWELGRNDSCQAITGTRNVFVDYPELAFDLFEADVPANYQSPSGGVSGGGGGDVGGGEDPDPIVPPAGDEVTGALTVGDTVLLLADETDGTFELSGISTTPTKYGLGEEYSGTPEGLYPLTVEAGSVSGTYSFKTSDGKYLYWSSGNSLNVNAAKSNNSSWNVTFADGNAIITNAGDSTRKLQWNASDPRFACYTSNQTAVQLYVLKPECTHVYDDDWDEDCNVCGALRPTRLYTDEVTYSAMEMSNTAYGLAFRFQCMAFGATRDNQQVGDLSNATVSYMGQTCKVLGMGAVMTNQAAVGTDTDVFTLEHLNPAVIEIPAYYLYQCDADSCTFSVRITNIPEGKQATTIYARAYCEIEYNGESLVVYDNVYANSYAQVMGD